jgi:hypothetical protein
VQEVLAQLLLAEVVGAGVVMVGELADGGDAAPLRSGREPPSAACPRSSRRAAWP